MVHLDVVHKPKPLEDILGDVSNLKLGPEGMEVDDKGSVSVYGSKFAASNMPRYELNEEEVPKEIAYRMIKDELALDGTPTLNLASFVTTYMEDEAVKLMTDAMSINFIDASEYRVSSDMSNRCVNMIARLFNVPQHDHSIDAMGTSTLGSSEAIMLATLAMKRRWANKRKAEGKDCSKPNIIMSSAVQVCWEKAARYFEVEEKYVYCTKDRFVLDPKEAVDLCDENTIGICVILGVTYTGQNEDAKAVNDLLVERGIDVPIHVDAASGGFVTPFIKPDLEWDFRLEKVVSINVSGHKYGLVYPGIGWCVWRSKEYLPEDLIFNINYLGEDQASFTLNFSRGASQIIGQYYQLLRLGKSGYRNIMINLIKASDYIAHCVEKLGFILMSEKHGNGLPLVAFRLPENKDRTYDEFAVAHQLRERGWIVPAYTMAPHAETLKMMRVVIREDFSRARAVAFIQDLKFALDTLDKMDAEAVKRYKDLSAATNQQQVKKKHNSQFKGEKHSLKGKHGKTHAVC